MGVITHPLFYEVFMIEIIVAAVVGLVVGGSVTFGIMNGNKAQEPIVIPSDPVAKELGKLDVVLPICEPDFIGKNGDGLCRELMCMTQTNSATGEVSGEMCSNITNLRNKKDLIGWCKKNYPVKEDFEECLEIFQKRGI